MSMSMHIIKLCVGAETVAHLAQWQDQHMRMLADAGQTPEIIHITRQTPKRAEEILHGGSIYWVIKGHIQVRQRLLALRPLEIDGIAHCGLVCDPILIHVHPRPRRPFQGWRYLASGDAPADTHLQSPHHLTQTELTPDIQHELLALGLI
jgi:hypothetical protein